MKGEAILSMIWLALGGIINGIETTVWKIKNAPPTTMVTTKKAKFLPTSIATAKTNAKHIK